ncbi:lysozyme inhibitor LprI family protein [Janthinobacterium sp. Mn2066]|uniref:lysozyme inhibitor LprI family protein n=1 Tax=Janthinobacterium sp. Mn2066 TaxID=3395264 RepID=UPI003BB9BB9D
MLLGLFALLAAQSATAQSSYPNTSAMGVGHAETTAWYGACMKVANAAPPAADLPPPSAVAGLQRCEPINMYYDTKSMSAPKPADWQPVRQCALVQKNNAVLMMLYQNGLGVVRNPALALKSACGIDAAPAEMEGRVAHLQKLDASGAHGDIDLCDDITSGYMMGVCSGIDARQKQRARTAANSKLNQTLPAAAQAALQALQQATDKFATARGAKETDMSGTAGSSMAIDTRTGEMELLAHDLRQYEQGQLPQAGKVDAATLDKQLNVLYGKVMKQPQADYPGAVSKEGVRATQRLWLAYRDAWLRYGAARYPSVPADTWLALLTARRNAQLEELLQP